MYALDINWLIFLAIDIQIMDIKSIKKAGCELLAAGYGMQDTGCTVSKNQMN